MGVLPSARFWGLGPGFRVCGHLGLWEKVASCLRASVASGMAWSLYGRAIAGRKHMIMRKASRCEHWTFLQAEIKAAVRE